MSGCGRIWWPRSVREWTELTSQLACQEKWTLSPLKRFQIPEPPEGKQVNELFPTFSRCFLAARRVGSRFVRLSGRVARRTCKPAILTLLVLNALLTASNYLERKYMKRHLIPASEWSMSRYESSKNPYRHYEVAVRLLPDEDLRIFGQLWGSEYSYYSTMPPTHEQLARALAHIQPAIIELRKGAACSGKDFQFAYKRPSLSEPFCEHIILYRLARMAAFDAMRKLDQGNTKDSLGELLSIVEMGDDIGRDSPLIGGRISRIGYAKLHRALGSGKLSAAEHRMVAAELDRICSERPSLRRVMEGEYSWSRGGLEEILRADWDEYVQILTECCADPVIFLRKSLPGMKIRIVHNHNRIWAAILDSCDLSYPELMRRDIGKVGLKAVPICYAFTPDLSRFFGANALNKALDKGLMLVAALEAYRLEHETYPEKLHQLVGPYIRKVPTDPFTDGKSFVYSRKDARYLLYSIGPDMKDDGGKATSLEKISDENGDIVFAPDVVL